MLFLDMEGGQRRATHRTDQQTFRRKDPVSGCVGMATHLLQGSERAEEIIGNNRCMGSVKQLAVERNLAGIDRIAEDHLDCRLRPSLTMPGSILAIDDVHHPRQGGGSRIDVKHPPHYGRLLGVNDELLVLARLSIRRNPVIPQSFLGQSQHFVLRPLRNHLALKLGKAHEDVAQQAPGRGEGVEPRRHAHQVDMLSVGHSPVIIGVYRHPEPQALSGTLVPARALAVFAPAF